MAEEYTAAEIYEAQFFQLSNDGETVEFDDRPLKIMNLTKKLSSRNNLSNLDDNILTNEDEVTDTHPSDFFYNEPPIL